MPTFNEWKIIIFRRNILEEFNEWKIIIFRRNILEECHILSVCRRIVSPRFANSGCVNGVSSGKKRLLRIVPLDT